MKGPVVNVVWFKRDLRTSDHRALVDAAASGATLPIYVVEPELWQQPDASARQWRFVRESLIELDNALTRLGQCLIIRIGAVVEVLDSLHRQRPISALFSIAAILRWQNGAAGTALPGTSIRRTGYNVRTGSAMDGRGTGNNE